MSVIDKLTGRIKQLVGKASKDPSLRREGALEERKGEVKEELHEHERAAERRAEEIAEHERREQ